LYTLSFQSSIDSTERDASLHSCSTDRIRHQRILQSSRFSFSARPVPPPTAPTRCSAARSRLGSRPVSVRPRPACHKHMPARHPIPVLSGPTYFRCPSTRSAIGELGA
jgi:hypothetical protein